MATVGNNIVPTGLSGKLGNLIVFRNLGGKTVSPIHPATCQKENNRPPAKDEGIRFPSFFLKVEHKVRIK
jgi:hypothetical protein